MKIREDPSGFLTAAADQVNVLGAAAEHQEWWFDDKIRRVRDRNGDAVAETSDSEGKWIAALSPTIAMPLEVALRQGARELASAWALFEPGTERVVLDVADGRYTGRMGTTLWTEESRWEAIQPRWGALLGIASSILKGDSPHSASNPTTGSAEETTSRQPTKSDGVSAEGDTMSATAIATAGGVALTDDLLDALALEAEQGYALDRLRPRSGRRKDPPG